MNRRVASSLIAVFGLFGLAEQAGAVAIDRMLATSSMPMVGRMTNVLQSLEGRPCVAATPVVAPRIGGARLAQVTLQPAAQGASAQLSKASAILGGTVSALDRIRSDQAAQANLAAPTNLAAAKAETVPGLGLSPGAAPVAAASFSAATGIGCDRFALPSGTMAVAPGRTTRLPGSGANGGDDFLQTRRLAISRTAFDSQWDRVSRQGLSPRVVAGDAVLSRAARGGPTMAAVEAVNAWANRRIRFADDSKLYRTADYWATAEATLSRGAGDCEDIAIAKMQLLAAMGVPRGDMYLTIARDLARRADHALLVVRMDDRYWMLDNSTDRVLDAETSYDYQPVLSFSQGRKWLHGAVLASRD